MKKRFFILQVIILIALFFFNCQADQAKDEDDETPAKLYAIGDIGPSGVGIVFYITDGGLHGLEAAPGDQSTSQVWIEGGDTQTTENSNTFTGIGTGLANSNYIIAQTGHTGSAAQVCRSYTEGGLTDWFLPSKDELNELFTQRTAVGGFAAGGYWTSSEGAADSAWAQSFINGVQVHDVSKSYSYRVRAVRAF